MVQRKTGLVGPYSTEELRTAIGAGQVLRSDQVRFGQGGFRRISEFSVLAVSTSPPPGRNSASRPLLLGILAAAVLVIAGAAFLLVPRGGAPTSTVPAATSALVQAWPVAGPVPTRSASALRNELDDRGCARKAREDFVKAANLFSLATFADCVALAASPDDARQRQQLYDQISAFIAADPHVALLWPSKALLASSLGRKEDARLAMAAAASELRGDPRADLVAARLDDNAESRQSKINKLAATQLEAFALTLKQKVDAGQLNAAFSDLQTALTGPGERHDFALTALRRLARMTFLGDVVWRDLTSHDELIAEVGFLSSATETAQSQRAFFEPRLADTKTHALASLGVSVLLLAQGLDPQARAQLGEAAALPPDSGRALLLGVLAIHAGNFDEADKEFASAGPSLEARYFAALIHALRGDSAPMQALVGEIPGPLPSLIVCALSKEKDATLRMEALLGRDDGLAEMNPGHLPLFDGGLPLLLPKLISPDDAVVRALVQMWLNQTPPPVAGAPWFAGALAYQKKQYTRAAQILGPLAHGDDAEPPVLGLYGRVLEQVEPDWADDFYHDISKDGDNSDLADLGRLRLQHDKSKAEEHALALYKNGVRTPEVTHALFHTGSK